MRALRTLCTAVPLAPVRAFRVSVRWSQFQCTAFWNTPTRSSALIPGIPLELALVAVSESFRFAEPCGTNKGTRSTGEIHDSYTSTSRKCSSFHNSWNRHSYVTSRPSMARWFMTAQTEKTEQGNMDSDPLQLRGVMIWVNCSFVSVPIRSSFSPVSAVGIRKLTPYT